MAYELRREDLEPLLLGAAFFGSGGGGTIVSARHLAEHFLKGDYYPTDTVKVVSVDEATEGAAVMVAYLGAPEAINSATYPIGPVTAVQNVQKRLASQSVKLAYVMPPESGALGFTVAALVAAKLGLAVIDADGAGRAVPSLPMLTFAAAKIDPRPAFLVSQGGLCVELDVTPRNDSNGGPTHQRDVSAVVEQMMRPVVADPEFGQFGGLAMWVMNAGDIGRATPIRGTLKRALELGRAVQAGQIGSAQQMIDYLAERCDLAARAISTPGELVSAEVDTSGGFDVGKIRIQTGQRTYTVIYQNESLLAWDSACAQPIVLAPDSVAYFVGGEGQSIFSNGDLVNDDGSLNPAIGKRPVTLIAWRAEAELRKPGLILDSFMEQLNKLGYLGPYVPLESLQSARKGEAS
ncbi:S-methyl thiohydantoin desulfurase domain-containing protein [Paraburkholderia aromaticivorans]|uniref:S-methyl thiohydantoin desulfurase domain-containing protein n=1 Tax=Paraburkholderia aromaticivorans TaxID=2026199 RepID=UPI0038B7304F